MSSPQDIVFKDEQEKKQLEKIASYVAKAVAYQKVKVVPPANQHPLPQFAGQVVAQSPAGQDDQEPEIVDTIRGLQGKSRSAPAAQFLKEKMRWLNKKHIGASVVLK